MNNVNNTIPSSIKDENVKRLLSVIKTGKDNGIHQNKLALVMGWKPSEVKRLIQTIRINYDIIIISDDSGYYFPETDDDIRKFHNMMRKQAIQRLVTIRGIRKYLRMQRIDENRQNRGGGER